MVMSDEVPRELGEQRMQDSIFTRELADVYLLLDYVSGRSDKRLTSSLGDGDEKAGREEIQEICKIRWPPTGTPTKLADQADQAASLLLAKDRLNAAAKPASGELIAFTLLVAGDYDVPAAHGFWHWLKGRERTVQRPQMPAPVSGGDAPPRVPAGGGGASSSGRSPVEAADNSASPLSDNWDGQSLSRFSLARQAYPGFVRRAEEFNHRINFINILLLSWLIFTCLLSWYVAVGHTILAHISDIEATKIAILGRIPASDTSASSNAVPDSPKILTEDDWPLFVKNYCRQQPDNANQRRICDEFRESYVTNVALNDDLQHWFTPTLLFLPHSVNEGHYEQQAELREVGGRYIRGAYNLCAAAILWVSRCRNRRRTE